LDLSFRKKTDSAKTDLLLMAEENAPKQFFGIQFLAKSNQSKASVSYFLQSSKSQESKKQGHFFN
jgi:hypothetical protein